MGLVLADLGNSDSITAAGGQRFLHLRAGKMVFKLNRAVTVIQHRTVRLYERYPHIIGAFKPFREIILFGK